MEACKNLGVPPSVVGAMGYAEIHALGFKQPVLTATEQRERYNAQRAKRGLPPVKPRSTNV